MPSFIRKIISPLKPILIPLISVLDQILLKMIAYLEKQLNLNQSGSNNKLKNKALPTVGIIGAGQMGQMQCLGITKFGAGRVVAVADIDIDMLEGFSHKFTCIKTYNDAAEMLKNTELDIVSIATTAPSHMDLCRLSVEHGIRRIVVEKPIGIQLTKIHNIIELCNKKNIWLAVNHGRRWSKDYEKIKKAINGGEIGSVCQVYFSWRNGGLANLATHFVDIIRYLLGADVEYVIGKIDNDMGINPRGAVFDDPSGSAWLMFKGGVRCFLDLSQDLINGDKTFIIRGDKGQIEIDEQRKRWVISKYGWRDSNDRRVYKFEENNDIDFLYNKAITNALNGKSPKCSGEDGLAALEVIIAIHVSSENGMKKIHFPLEKKYRQIVGKFA